MNSRLGLKKATNWFAAGEGFLKAMELLSDGTFKLFVFLCLKADRRTATYHANLDQLASVIRMPRISIGRCLAELQAKGVCSLATANGAAMECSFKIADEFWPYQSAENASTAPRANDYVAAIRQQFLALGCASGRFGASEEAQARSLEKQGVPLEIVLDAMLMAACRKYCAWLNDHGSSPIQSIAYFESTIAEIQQQPLPPDYAEYLRSKLARFTTAWIEKKGANPPTNAGGSVFADGCLGAAK